MKYIVGFIIVGFGLFSSCDKVENAYPVGVPSTGLNFGLYPNGDSIDYVNNGQWPVFTTNTNVNRNVLIEDFTGHKCTFCPLAATEAENIEAANPGRVFSAANHTSPTGIGSFQSVEAPDFTYDFTCSEGLVIGQYFGIEWPSSAFVGNPRGTINRQDDGSGQVTLGPANWSPTATSILSANNLRVNLQAASNYYPATRGYFLHTEIDVIDAALTNELSIVVYVVEDSIVKPQKMPDNSVNHNYVHRNVLFACLDGRAFGQTLDTDHKDVNGKYYFNYSYELPAQYSSTNSHVIIYVRDAVTEEIYQVIEQHIE